MNQFQLLLGDCREVLKTLPANSVDAIVTDPPYGLEFMGKEWDAPWKSKDVRQPDDPTFTKTDNAYGRSKVRYAMGSSYGSGNEAMVGFQEWYYEIAKEMLRVLKPGGHVLSFGGSRTYHRMACAIEDAGFEVRDQMMWVYGSGFPKSHNISKALDKSAGIEREDKFEGAFKRFAGPTGNKKCDKCGKWLVSGSPCQCPRPQDEPNCPAAKQWEGWGTALKPAHEPIVLARKPLEGTVVDNIRKWGVGGLNIDGCRVQNNGEQFKNLPNWGGGKQFNKDGLSFSEQDHDHKDGGNAESVEKLKTLGRFPANLIHDGSQGVLDLFPREAGAAAPVKAGYSGDAKNGIYHDYAQRGDNGATFYSDKGSAARFFYCAKASKSDREEGCGDLPTQEKPAHMRTANGQGEESMESGNWPTTQRKNTHPTVKPTELMRYLVRLITPPNGVVLDPFNGSGSTGKAAMLEGCRYIGIEMNPEYIKVAEARISDALKQ
jgi:site-specific DNA-methyltransferase (adenine-specific)